MMNEPKWNVPNLQWHNKLKILATLHILPQFGGQVLFKIIEHLIARNCWISFNGLLKGFGNFIYIDNDSFKQQKFIINEAYVASLFEAITPNKKSL
jgi:hypothetical protein